MSGPRAPARRLWLQRAAALGAASFLRPLAHGRATTARFRSHPFALGVASGSPRTDGVVIWTRVLPADGSEPVEDRVEVRWEVAEDERFGRIVRKGVAMAASERGHSVHVEPEGLRPGREYFYRFIAGGEASASGRTRTAPARGRGDERLRLAFASCQQYEQGWYGAHRHLAREGVDLVAFLGDYIYEASWGRRFVRHHDSPEPRTLDEYRRRYAQYKRDPDLQGSHAAAPWIVIWDDHEVANDYAADRSQDLDPEFLARRAAAYRAFLEHQPLRRDALLEDGGVRIYGRHEWGGLATLHALDDRQYRSHQACPREGRGGSNVVRGDCAERLEDARTILGAAQERWLDESFARPGTAWNVIAQQTLFTPGARRNTNGELLYWTDGWDGYPAARERLLGSLVRHRLANPVFIGGDVHANFVANVRARPGDGESGIVAAEFCGTSITSQYSNPKLAAAIRQANPDMLLADGSRRGYVVLDIGRESAEARLRCIDSEKSPDPSIATVARFTVRSGIPGVQEA